MEKTLDEYFCDWFSENFGYGYGTGDTHFIRVLHEFMSYTPEKGCYDYQILEFQLGAETAWLLINILARCGIIEYGTSTRYGWLDHRQGVNLRKYILSKPPVELNSVLRQRVNASYISCMPNYCNCENGKKCENPFWENRLIATVRG